MAILTRTDVKPLLKEIRHNPLLWLLVLAMTRATYVASFLGREPGRALFVGLYEIGASRPLTFEQYWKVPAYTEMKEFGTPGEGRRSVLWFDLTLTGFYADWKGKLIVGSPPPRVGTATEIVDAEPASATAEFISFVKNGFDAKRSFDLGDSDRQGRSPRPKPRLRVMPPGSSDPREERF